MEYHILFLCSCSNHKVKGGEREYRADGSMPNAIRRRASALYEARYRALKRVQDGAESEHGTLLRNVQYNAELVAGPDIGGTGHGTYLPAMARYRGRFYEALDPGEEGLLERSPHHWVIVSALYGLLAPGEPIQRYSCDAVDKQIRQIWTARRLITSLLLEYVRVSRIKLIVDLTAERAYQDLFDWSRISKHCGVLRAFGSQNAGPALLPALGSLARKWLWCAPADDIFGIETETYITDYEDVVLTRSYDDPPEGFLAEPFQAREQEAFVDEKDAPTASPAPVQIREEGRAISRLPRDIPVSSRGHSTIFGKPITRIGDLPPDVQPLFDQVSRAVEVLGVIFGRRSRRTGGRTWRLDIAEPGSGSDGNLNGELRGPGQEGQTQYLRVRVTRGRERATYRVLRTLLGLS